MRHRCAAKFLVCLSCLSAGIACWPSVGPAQSDSSVFQMPERTLLQHLSRAKRAINEDRYSDAVIELGALLNSPFLSSRNEQQGAAQDYFVGPVDETGTRRSIKGEAQRLLGSMPKQGRELYELQFGADARALLDRAVRDQSMEDLNEVIRRYFHTEAGYEAMVLLGRLQLDRGRPLAAALCFKRVLDSPAAAQKYEPHLAVLLGACWVYSNMPEQAVATMTQLRERFPQLEVELAAGHREPLPTGDTAVAWLTKHFGPLPRRGQIDASQWLVHRGNLQRNATSAGGVPLTQLRWRTPTTTDPGDEKLVAELQQGFISHGIPAIPTVSPLAVDDVVLMRTPERLLAVSFETGKRVWEYPWWNSSFPGASETTRSGSRTVEISTRKMQLRQRLWLDSAYGLISSDGASVYLLDDLQFSASAQSEPQFLPGRGFRPINPNYPKSHNLLVALDVAREGALRWKVGGEQSEEEPKLAGAFFMGPPLPLLGQLYAIAEVNRELRLVVLNAATGKQEWTQQIAHVADQPALGRNRARRLAGATPSFGNGVLICPTSAGAVVALDVTTRSLLWGYAYPQAKTETNGFGLTPFASAPETPGETWADATATIADGAVLLTPVESNHLYCLDLLTGVPKWEPKERAGDLADMQFVACVHDGNAILVGKHSLMAIRIKDGGTAWTLAMGDQANEMPSGRGFQTGDRYFFPTTKSELVEVDLSAGKIVQRVKSPRVLGNLLCYDNQVISQGVDQLAAFYQIDPLREVVDARLAESNDDPWALARKGELLVHDGESEAALDVLRRAHELAPRDDSVRTLLVSSFLELLRDDFAGYVGIAPAIDAQIQLPHLRLEFLRLMAVGMEASGDLAGAAERYLQLATMQIQNYDPNGVGESPTVMAEPRRTVRLDRWVRTRLAHVYEQADADGKAKMNAAIRNENATETELRQLIRYFGFHPLADQARLQLVTTLALSDRVLESDLLLARLEKRLGREQTGPAVAAIAAKFMEFEEPALAAMYYRRLGTGWSDVDCGDGRTGRELLAAAANDPALRGRLSSLTDWPRGQTRWHESQDRRTRQTRQGDLYIPMLEQQRPAGRQFVVAYDRGVSSIVVQDGQGEEWLRLPLADGTSYSDQLSGVNYAKVFGQLLYVVLGDQSFALDLSRGPQSDAALLWKAGLSVPHQEIGMARPNAREWKNINPLDRAAPDSYSMLDAAGHPIGSAGPVTDVGVTYLDATTLLCVEPLTGEPIWQRREMEAGSLLFGDDELIFAAPRESTTSQVIDARTGQLLGERKVPDWQHRWATQGRLVLGWEELPAETTDQPGQVRLFLYDAWQEADVWSQTFSDGARGVLVDEDQVAVMEPDGRFLIRSLTGDAVVLSQQVQPEPLLTAIYVLPSSDRYVLVTDTDQVAATDGASPDAANPPRRWQPLVPSLQAPMIFGHVHALARGSGEPLWQTPATIENYALPLIQPNETPTLWFLRRGTSAKSLKSPAPSEIFSVFCLDRRDGRELLAVNDVPLNNTGLTVYDVQVEFENRLVTWTVNGSGFVVEFTDEPAVPEPTAQTGSAANPLEAESGLWRFGGAVINAILPTK